MGPRLAWSGPRAQLLCKQGVAAFTATASSDTNSAHLQRRHLGGAELVLLQKGAHQPAARLACLLGRRGEPGGKAQRRGEEMGRRGRGRSGRGAGAAC